MGSSKKKVHLGLEVLEIFEIPNEMDRVYLKTEHNPYLKPYNRYLQ